MNPTHVSKCSCSSESFNDKLQSRVWLLIVVLVRCIDCCNLCEIDVFGCIWWQDACACAPTSGTCNQVVMFQLIAWTILMRDNLFQPVWLPECSSDHVSTAVKFCFKHVSSLLHTFASYFSRMCAWMYAAISPYLLLESLRRSMLHLSPQITSSGGGIFSIFVYVDTGPVIHNAHGLNFQYNLKTMNWL